MPTRSRNLPYAAGFAVAFGLPYDEAIKALRFIQPKSGVSTTN